MNHRGVVSGAERGPHRVSQVRGCASMTVLIRFQSGHSVRFRDLGRMEEEELVTGHRRQPQPDFTFTAANPALQLRRRGLEPTHPQYKRA